MDEPFAERLADIAGYLMDVKVTLGARTCNEVVRVYTGLQPGDVTGLRSETREKILGDFEGLRSRNNEFMFDVSDFPRGKIGPEAVITYWNQVVVDGLAKYPNLPERFKKRSMKHASGYRARVEGAFYGFPECCIEAWILENDVGSDVISSLAYRARRVFGDLRAERRERDRVRRDMRRYIEHIPCTATCEQTIRMVEQYKQVQEFVDEL